MNLLNRILVVVLFLLIVARGHSEQDVDPLVLDSQVADTVEPIVMSEQKTFIPLPEKRSVSSSKAKKYSSKKKSKKTKKFKKK